MGLSLSPSVLIGVIGCLLGFVLIGQRGSLPLVPSKAFTSSIGAAPFPADLAQKHEAFLEWCRRVGIKWPNVELAVSGYGGLGTFAKKDFKPGEKMICVPSTAIFGRDEFARTGLAPLLEEEEKKVVKPSLLLALFVARMLFDREHEPWGDQAFGPYFDMWPRDTMDLPTLWTPADQEKLMIFLEAQPLPSAEHVPALLQRYPEVFGDPPRAAYTQENVTRAHYLLQSRAFGPISPRTQEKGGWHLETLIPAFDHANHEPDAKTAKKLNTIRQWYYSDDDTKVCFSAGRPIKKGEEIFNFYGGELVSQFFARYGFLHNDDTTDAFLFMFDAVIDHSFVPTAEVARRSKGNRGYYIVRSDVNSFNTTLLPWARLKALYGDGDHAEKTADEITAMTARAFCSKGDKKCDISKAENRAARETLRTILLELFHRGNRGVKGEEDFIQAHQADPEKHVEVTAARYRARFKSFLSKGARLAGLKPLET